MSTTPPIQAPVSGTSTSDAYTGPGGVVTIGNFDGVHAGHQALLRAAIACDAGPVIAFTFDPVPRDVLRPGNPIQRLQTLPERVQALLDHGADHVVVEPFDLDYAARSPQSFAHDILRDRLHCTAVVVGWDFAFGKGRAGHADALRELLDVPVVQVEALHLDGEPVSSSRIRKSLEDGDVETAARLLTRPHRLSGTVVHGQARGRTLGFPTANLELTTPKLPRHGVYAVRVGSWRGVANLGNRPTIPGAPPSFEVHLLDVDEDLYGQVLGVDLIARLRDECTFATLDALREQIRLDVEHARSVLK